MANQLSSGASVEMPGVEPFHDVAWVSPDQLGAEVLEDRRPRFSLLPTLMGEARSTILSPPPNPSERYVVVTYLITLLTIAFGVSYGVPRILEAAKLTGTSAMVVTLAALGVFTTLAFVGRHAVSSIKRDARGQGPLGRPPVAGAAAAPSPPRLAPMK